jgi:hypothetical protein
MLQTTGICPVHTPVWQLNAPKHAFGADGTHAVPLATAAYEQLPLDGLQVPGA